MRTYFVCSVLLALLSLTATQVLAQDEGDPVTFTVGRVVYTGVLDPDLDTVSETPISTISTTSTVTTAVATTTTAVGAAAGGGAGTLTSATGLQSISGYTAPTSTVAPSPTNYSSGSILSASQIPGYTGTENTDGVTSGGIKLSVAKAVVGSIAGALVFAMM